MKNRKHLPYVKIKSYTAPANEEEKIAALRGNENLQLLKMKRRKHQLYMYVKMKSYTAPENEEEKITALRGNENLQLLKKKSRKQLL